MTERYVERGVPVARPLSGAPGDLSVEVDRHPLIPLHPPHFEPRTAGPAFPPLAPGPRSSGHPRLLGPEAKKAKARPRTRRFRRRTLILIVILGPMLLLGVVVVGGGLYLENELDSQIDRFPDPFAAIPAAERPVAAHDAQNILLLGSDSRISAGDPTKWRAGAQRTDAIMILHIPASRSEAYVVSIPRDSWVDIPGHGQNKINAAFSFGGPALAVRTIEQLTGIRIDHVMIADFEGFSGITDAIGGVQITVPASSGVKGANVPAGTRTMDGATALKYVRERYHLPGGDFDRVKRQQNWMRAIATKTLSGGVLKHPTKLYNVLKQFTGLIQVDDGFSIGDMRSLGWSMRDVRGNSLYFMSAPVSGTGRSPDGKQSIVNLAPDEDTKLFGALAKDRVDFWVAQNSGQLLGNNVR